MTGPLRVAHVTFHRPSRGREPERLLADLPHYTGLLAALRAAGLDVAAVQAAGTDREVTRPEAAYHFVADRGGWGDRWPPVPRRLADKVADLRPDVIHLHGLALPGHVRVLRGATRDVPILAQDHANRPPRWWERPRFLKGFASVEGFAFSTAEHAEPFRRIRGWPPEARIFPIMESSTGFGPGDRNEARALTGLAGDPAVLWVGRLDANKDPVTVMEGLSQVAGELPDLQVWCCYSDATGLPGVRGMVESRGALHGRAHWLGAVPHERIELLLRAADVYVAGSHREGSGYALLEAMACGTPAVVTAIPSFRAILGDPPVGALFPPGDASAFADAFRRVWSADPARLRPAVRARFDAHLSYPALARSLAEAYRSLRGDGS